MLRFELNRNPFSAIKGGQYPPECHENYRFYPIDLSPVSGGQHGPEYPVVISVFFILIGLCYLLKKFIIILYNWFEKKDPNVKQFFLFNSFTYFITIIYTIISYASSFSPIIGVWIIEKKIITSQSTYILIIILGFLIIVQNYKLVLRVISTNTPLIENPKNVLPFSINQEQSEGMIRAGGLAAFSKLFIIFPVGSSIISYSLSKLGFSIFQFTNGDAVVRLFDHLYFAFVSITTLGFGDIIPASNIGKIIVICNLIIFVGIISGFLNHIVSLHFKVDEKE